VARINTASITLCALLFTTLTFTPLASASEQTRGSGVHKTHVVKASERKKTSPTEKTSKKSSGTALKATAKAENKKTTATKKASNASKKTSSTKTSKNTSRHSKSSKTSTPVVAMTEKCTKRKGHKTQCIKVKGSKPVAISEAHKVRIQKIQKTAMSKLMNQIGKPYHWGGTSPMTGFDCSGLVYYAYKDLVKFRIPRTANEMYHLRDASPVNVAELESGDLVFFRTQGRGTADHVGVYVGNGKFIQSPRSGQDIQITSLSEDYWQRHYVGARRVVTPKTIR
jgi:murein DD-endopeptidase